MRSWQFMLMEMVAYYTTCILNASIDTDLSLKKKMKHIIIINIMAETVLVIF